MRLTTEVWARFESKGRPSATLTLNKQLGFVAKDFVPWLLEHAMGHYIKVTIARSKDELERWSRDIQAGKESQDALLNDFNSALADLGFGDEESPSETQTDVLPKDHPEQCGRCGFAPESCTCPEDER